MTEEQAGRLMLGLTSAAPHPLSQRLGASLDLAAIIRQAQSCDYQTPLDLGRFVPPNAFGNAASPCCVEVAYLLLAAMRRRAAMGSTWLPTGDQAIALLAKWGDPAEGTNLADAQRLAAVQGMPLGNDLDVCLSMQLPLDPAVLDAAAWLWGGILLCWALPLYLQDNPYAETWDVAPPGASDAATAPGGWGQHATASGRRDAIVSWGLQPEVTPAFQARYLVAAMACDSSDFMTTTGRTVPGFDRAQVPALVRAFGGMA